MKTQLLETSGPSKDREQLILQHLHRIKYIAHRIALGLPSNVEFNDLVSAGVIGLLDAVDKFDESRGVKFKTYAELRIRGAILDSLRQLDWAPRSLRRKRREVEQAYGQLEQQLGRSASDEEVAEKLGISTQDFHALLNQLKGLNIGHLMVGRAEEVKKQGDNIALQSVPSREEDQPLQIYMRKELRETLARLIQSLPEPERLVVTLYHFEELTMKEVGEILGVNESRICQLHTRAILRLRGKLKNTILR